MKGMSKFFMAAIAVMGFSTCAFAQATASATGTATIVAPISITKTADMNFGNVAVSATAGTVILAPAGTRTVTGGATLPVTAGTVSAAAFDVAGEGTYTYAITLPSTAYTLTDPVSSATMDVDTFTSTPSGTGALAAGTESITVGATLNVDAAQASGTYTNATGFDVTVNYN